MIDAYYEDQEELSSSSCSSSMPTPSTSTNTTTTTNNNNFDLIKDYLISKHGKVKLTELNAHFKELGIDSNSIHFRETLANLTTIKHDVSEIKSYKL